MIINYHGQENFTIKTKNQTIKIGERIALGNLEITTPGEYETGGVQVDVIDGIIEVLTEKMTICWMKKAKALSDEELERMGSINVLLVGVGGGDFTETKNAIDVINQIDPQIVIPMYNQNLESFLKEESVSETLSLLKLNPGDLVEGERKVFVLNAS